MQSLVIALMAGPWAVWTRNPAFYGFPAGRSELTAQRAASFVLGTFEILPPVPMAVAVLGLIALLSGRRPHMQTCRKDTLKP